MGQARELQVRTPGPAGQRDSLLQVSLCFPESGGPQVGNAQADQGQRPQIFPEVIGGRVRGLGHGLQLPCLLGHRGQVPALARQQ